MSSVEKSTVARGNTKNPCLKNRSFLLTLNEIDKYEDLSKYLLSRNPKYYISALEEAPTTGHEHIHIYIYFKQTTTLSIKKCLGAHIDKCRGTPQQNINYVKKDGEIIEEQGEEPRQGGYSVKTLLEYETVEDLPDYRMVKTWEHLKQQKEEEESFFNMLNEIKNGKVEPIEINYITGDSGTGKTRTAYTKALENYEEKDIGKITFENGFAKILNKNAKCFVIEEFRPSDMKASKFLEFTDPYYKNKILNVKGGFEVLNKIECLYICSIIAPGLLYNNEENTKQFIRRIKNIFNL